MRFLFDTSVLVDYLRDENSLAADALSVAAEKGEVLISLVSIMELYQPDTDRKIVEREIKAIEELCQRWGIRLVYVTKKGQDLAKKLIQKYYANLGKSAVPDALILSTGIQWRAYVVSKNVGAWRLVYNKVRSIEEFLEEFA